MMSEGFVGNVDSFKFFFWLCVRYGINDEKERIALLRKLVARHRMKYARDGEALIKNKTVLGIRRQK